MPTWCKTSLPKWIGLLCAWRRLFCSMNFPRVACPGYTMETVTMGAACMALNHGGNYHSSPQCSFFGFRHHPERYLKCPKSLRKDFVNLKRRWPVLRSVFLFSGRVLRLFVPPRRCISFLLPGTPCHSFVGRCGTQGGRVALYVPIECITRGCRRATNHSSH